MIKKKLYNSDDVQAMLNEITEKKLVHKFTKEYEAYYNKAGRNDLNAILYVINEGWYEDFYRFDSDVVEQFITICERILL